MNIDRIRARRFIALYRFYESRKGNTTSLLEMIDVSKEWSWVIGWDRALFKYMEVVVDDSRGDNKGLEKA